MSATTSALAVAVSASSVGLPNEGSALPISRKAGRKSWPHCEMQCASSMTTREGGRAANSATNAGSASRSGVVKTMVALPSTIAAFAAAVSSALMELLSCTAAMPCSRSLSHWSFINAINGETTRVGQGNNVAGSW